MRFLVFGAGGLVGGQLARRGPTHGFEVVALTRAEADLERPETLAAAIADHAPDAVINAAAYTAVDKAEAEEGRALAVNAEAPRAMAVACRELGVPFLHISTDQVFSGEGARAWREDDPTDPVNAYGRSKARGEVLALEAWARTLVVRTSWVFGPGGRNFVQSLAAAARTKPQLDLVDDQVARPTFSGDLAEFLLGAAAALAGGAERYGLLHYANAEPVTRFDFGAAVIEAAGIEPRPALRPVPTSAFPTPARRPLNCVLDLGRLERVWGMTPRSWRPRLAETLAEG